MAFVSEPEPARGIPLAVETGICRVVAPNPGPLTYHGTNTWLIAGPDGTTVIDPGPDDAGHVQAVVAASGRIARILVTHRHRDHVGALAALEAATGAPVLGFAEGLRDGDRVADWVALHTPGHTPDHICFARDDGAIISGDHVMSWSTSIVSPPDGDMAAYFTSLRRLLGRDDRLLLSGHGPPHHRPRVLVRHLLAHRQLREDAIVQTLHAGPCTVEQLVATLYTGLAAPLLPAAARNVIAHLGKLVQEGRAAAAGDSWRAV